MGGNLFIALSLMLIQPSFAQDDMSDLDFVNIEQGDEAPFAGKLLTNEALAAILSRHQLEIDNLKIQHQAELERQSLDAALKYDVLDTRFKLDTELYTSMIDNRDMLLKDFDPNPRSSIGDWKFTGGFIAGAVVTVGIAYSLDKLVY